MTVISPVATAQVGIIVTVAVGVIASIDIELSQGFVGSVILETSNPFVSPSPSQSAACHIELEVSGILAAVKLQGSLISGSVLSQSPSPSVSRHPSMIILSAKSSLALVGSV